MRRLLILPILLILHGISTHMHTVHLSLPPPSIETATKIDHSFHLDCSYGTCLRLSAFPVSILNFYVSTLVAHTTTRFDHAAFGTHFLVFDKFSTYKCKHWPHALSIEYILRSVCESVRGNPPKCRYVFD